MEFEFIDVVLSAVVAGFFGWMAYSSSRNAKNRPPFDKLVKRLIRHQQESARRMPWEHAAVATSYGLTWFAYFTFNAAANLSYSSFCLRLVGTVAAAVVTYLLVRAVVRPVFRYIYNRPKHTPH